MPHAQPATPRGRAAPFLLSAVLWVSPAVAGAEEPTRVGEIVGPQELLLADGRTVRLAGIWVDPADGAAASAASAALASWLDGRLVTLDPPPAAADRHGRLRAQARAREGMWLQGELVRRGFAVAAPAPDVADGRVAQPLALEREARLAARGVWSGGAVGPWPAERVAAERGRYVLVSGRVREVARVQDQVYLNFGEDWRSDFTLRAEARRARAFAKAGLDLERLAGRNVLARGHLFEIGGPMIELVHPAQIGVVE
jgi:endonuclease YncB( thermonuclease family)